MVSTRSNTHARVFISLGEDPGSPATKCPFSKGTLVYRTKKQFGKK